MANKPMSKTAVAKIVREIRMEASAINNAMSVGGFSSEEARNSWIADRLNNIEGMAAQLREEFAPDTY